MRLSIGRIPMGPNALRYADRLVGILRAGRLPDALALTGHQLPMSIVIGFAIDETGESGHPPADQPPPDAAAGHFADADGDERFELLLDIFVSGLAQRAGPAGARRR